MLFRYSALTANGHRIHYDLDYVTKEEGYPGLVVHGPLQATLLADLVRRNRPGSYITRFGFRGRRPAFHQNDLTLLGWEQDGNPAAGNARPRGRGQHGGRSRARLTG